MMSITEDMACSDFVELVTEYLENELPIELRGRFEQHLDICSGCREYLHQIRVSIDALRQAWERTVPPDDRERLLQCFREWKATEEKG